MTQLCDKQPFFNLTCLSPLPPCSLLGDTETSPWGAKKQTAHDFWPGHESCSWTTGAASTRGKRELSFGEFYIHRHGFQLSCLSLSLSPRKFSCILTFFLCHFLVTMKTHKMFWRLCFSCQKLLKKKSNYTNLIFSSASDKWSCHASE